MFILKYNLEIIVSVSLSCLQYAVESQVRLRGFDPQESTLLLSPRAVRPHLSLLNQSSVVLYLLLICYYILQCVFIWKLEFLTLTSSLSCPLRKHLGVDLYINTNQAKFGWKITVHVIILSSLDSLKFLLHLMMFKCCFSSILGVTQNLTAQHDIV